MAKGSSKAKGSAVHLSWRTLGDLDNGMAGAVIDHALAAAVRDTEDRGLEDEKPRKVVITVEMTKIDDDSIAVGVDVKSSNPPYKTRRTTTGIKFDGKAGPALQFQPLASDNPAQETMFTNHQE